MSMMHEPSGGNPLEIEAQADELEAEAFRLRATAKRLRAQAESTPKGCGTERLEAHMTRAEYARRSNVSDATVSRWLAAGMPAIPVGTTVRIDAAAADEWRCARGRKPTTPAVSSRVADLDVDADLARAGLRVVGGR